LVPHNSWEVVWECYNSPADPLVGWGGDEIWSVDSQEIVKIVANKCQIFRLKCTKIDFGWDSAPDPAGRAYSAPPGPYLDLRGPTSNGWGI